ncbi:hypothetical protein D1872_38230 [compost metagenome]
MVAISRKIHPGYPTMNEVQRVMFILNDLGMNDSHILDHAIQCQLNDVCRSNVTKIIDFAFISATSPTMTSLAQSIGVPVHVVKDVLTRIRSGLFEQCCIELEERIVTNSIYSRPIAHNMAFNIIHQYVKHGNEDDLNVIRWFYSNNISELAITRRSVTDVELRETIHVLLPHVWDHQYAEHYDHTIRESLIKLTNILVFEICMPLKIDLSLRVIYRANSYLLFRPLYLIDLQRKSNLSIYLFFTGKRWLVSVNSMDRVANKAPSIMCRVITELNQFERINFGNHYLYEPYSINAHKFSFDVQSHFELYAFLHLFTQ